MSESWGTEADMPSGRVAGPVVVALAAALAGLAVTAVRIVDRRVSWPFALVTLGVCLVAVGIEGYSAFVA